MKLTYEQIKSITLGADRILENDGKYVFWRFNEKELDFFSKTALTPRETSTSGIQFEFKTDAKALTLTGYISLATPMTFYAFDVFVNGKFFTAMKNYTGEEIGIDRIESKFEIGDFEYTVDLPDGQNTVRIVFPWTLHAEIKDLILEGATFAEPVKKSKTLLMYGDSITQGYNSENPSKSYAVALAWALDAEAYNKGVGGACYFPALSEIKCDVNPDYITVAYGTNDWNQVTQPEFESNVRGFLTNLRTNYPTVKIIIITPIWRADYENEKPFGDFRDVERIVKNVASEIENTAVISGWNLVPHETASFADTKLHPSNKGFEHYFANLIKEVRKVL